ncbi:MAG TPA: peptidoglycan-binding protein [Geminicoccaceae bacterium]|nr:peptidoglycan-binding protein [Geminicoccus sp.]HMU49549.1 peptidoglycan-binding protein [Geminicoccaceae bacterium]
MRLAKALLRALFPRAAEPHLAAFATQSDGLLVRFGIDATPTRLHFFLAQLGHESGGLTVTAENMSYSAQRMTEVWPGRFPSLASARPFERNPERLANHVYANRMGNGPEGSGDGFRYRGRGYIQITGRDGYAEVGREAALDLVRQPDLAFAPEHALLVACGFWRWKGLNELCDTGDFEKVTRRINGGTTGMADRRAWLDKVRRTLMAVPAAEEQPPAAEVIAVQRALQARRFTEVGAADGIVGPRTIAAITRFRQQNGLPAGMIDGELKRALGIEPAVSGPLHHPADEVVGGLAHM